MSWRTVVVSSRCKLDLKMGYMVIRGEETKRVFLDEIALVLIENPAVAITGCLLEALAEKKIRVILCDGKRTPYAEVAPYYGSHDCSRKLHRQAAWEPEAKANVWKSVIYRKIRLQSEHLRDCGSVREADLLQSYLPQILPGDTTNRADLLQSYLPQILPGDTTNREGHAAKVYFNALFGMDFTRTEECPTNAALNYGYSIILSAFNRSVTAAGYSTILGIHHKNVFNHYNLSSDIMEPYRILVDRTVKALNPREFNKDIRYLLVSLLNNHVIIDGADQTVLNSIDIYTRSVMLALQENDPNLIKYYCL